MGKGNERQKRERGSDEGGTKGGDKGHDEHFMAKEIDTVRRDGCI